MYEPTNEPPTTEREFRAAIRSLVETAVANDVDVENGWGFTEDGEGWGIEIYRVAPAEAEE